MRGRRELSGFDCFRLLGGSHPVPHAHLRFDVPESLLSRLIEVFANGRLAAYHLLYDGVRVYEAVCAEALRELLSHAGLPASHHSDQVHVYAAEPGREEPGGVGRELVVFFGVRAIVGVLVGVGYNIIVGDVVKSSDSESVLSTIE